MMNRLFVAMLIVAASAPGLSAQRQAPEAALLQERRDHATYLRDGPTNPHEAVAHQPVGTGLTLGPASTDIPLTRLARHEILVSGRRVSVREPNGKVTPLPRGKALPIESGFFLLLRGTSVRPVLTVFGNGPAHASTPTWFAPDPAQIDTVVLQPPKAPTPLTLLDADGVDVAAAEAGTVVLSGGETLRVRRLATGEDESELELFFRDATNGRDTYPAGRFLTVVPLRDGRYVLDFNRARNPSCAYNTVFPCPAPWPGNALRRPIRAGERYKAK